MSDAVGLYKEIIVIGAGPQGLATAIALQEKFKGTGAKIRILEANDAPGQGLSKRPEFAEIGTIHSGGTFTQGTERAKVCADIYEMLRQNPEEDGEVMKIFRQHTFDPNDPEISGAKLFVARKTKKDIDNLKTIAKNLEGAGVKFKWVDDPEEIAALKEPIADPNNTAALIRLTESKVLNIPAYVEGLQKKFLENGGEIDYSRRVVDFEVPHINTRHTGVVCETKDGKKLHYVADAVVNVAGLESGPIADKAAAALRHSKVRIWGAEAEPPRTPKFYFNDIFVFVPKEGKSPSIRHQSYISGLAKLTGPADKATVGPHTFMSIPNGDETFSATIGPFNFKRTRETLGDLDDPKLLAEMEVRRKEMIQQAKKVWSDFDPNDWELKHAGSECSALDAKDNSVYVTTDCEDDSVGFKVKNRFTCYTPGLTGGPVLAYKTAIEMRKEYDERLKRNALLKKFDKRFPAVERTPLRRISPGHARRAFRAVGAPLCGGGYCRSAAKLFGPIKNEILIKQEFSADPAKTVKSRPAHFMTRKAIMGGNLDRDTTIVVDSLGSFGAAFAAIGKKMGFKVILVGPFKKELQETRERLLTKLGAEIVYLSPENRDPASVIGMTHQIRDELEAKGHKVYLASQFRNRQNWMAHYMSTGPEVLSAMGGRSGSFEAAFGSGGTLTGITNRLRNRQSIRKIGVEAAEAPMIASGHPKSHRAPGMSPGYEAMVTNETFVDGEFIELDQVPSAEARSTAAAVKRIAHLDIGFTTGAILHGTFRRARVSGYRRGDRNIVIGADRGDAHKVERHPVNFRSVDPRYVKSARETDIRSQGHAGTAVHRAIATRHQRPPTPWMRNKALQAARR